MNHLGRPYQVWLCVLLVAAGFILAGAVLLPYNGVEEDEALFSGPIFHHGAPEDGVKISRYLVPLMVMDYVGALKSWLYFPIFHLFQSSPASLRFPVLIIGAITICLFARLLERIAGLRAAVAGAVLLATDTMFLMTTEFDWGPVAIQHLTLVAACLFLLDFARTNSRMLLAAGFFMLGLGLWDKAIFSWSLAGLVIAAAVVFAREVRRRINAPNLAIALAAFLAGCAPLIIFNLRYDWRTFRGNAAFSAENLLGKADVVRSTLNGGGLFGYMVNPPSDLAHDPETQLQRASLGLSDFARHPHYNLLVPALTVAIIAGLLFRRTRSAILFALVFMFVTWLAMALTKNAGGSVHHTVLLWPFPHLILAIVLAEVSRRSIPTGPIFAIAALVALSAANLLVTNQYLAQLIRYGPSITWSDAIYPLSTSLRNETAEIFTTDWDCFNSLILLNHGRLKIHPGIDFGDQNPQMVANLLALPRAIFITHTPPHQFFPAATQRLESAAAARHYRKEILYVIADSHGQPVFEVYQFVPGS